MPENFNEWAATPWRSTTLEVDLPEVLLGRSTYSVPRSADQIKKAKTRGFPASSNVRRLPGLAWSITPGLTDWTNAITTAAPTHGFTVSGSLLDLAGFNVVAGDNSVVQHLAYKNPSDLPGVSTPGSLVPQGVPVWRRVVPAGESWSNELTADVLAVPKPTLPSQHVAMDRLMVGRQTYPPNVGFVLGWYRPPLAGSVQDTLLSFYFGGSSDTDPAPSRNRGYWCVSVRGDGSTFLHEQEGQTWQERDEFRYANEPRPRGGLTTLEILPIGKDRMAFRSSAIASDITEGGAYFAMKSFRRSQSDFLSSLFQHTKARCGHDHKKNISGSGNLRIDLRRDSRMQLMVGLQTYAAEAIVYDEPFEIPMAPAGVVMRVMATKEEPAGTSIQITLYDATTHAPLTTNDDGNFLTNSGQRFYYAKIRFTSDSTRLRAPYLFAYSVEVEGLYTLRDATPVTGGDLLQVSITGPDKSPDHETASFSLDDPTNELKREGSEAPILATRGRVHGRIRTTEREWSEVESEWKDVFSVLFQGEIDFAPNHQLPMPDLENGVIPAWPSGNRRRYDNVTMNGMWSRVSEIPVLGREFLKDPATGNFYKAKDFVSGLFTKAGFPPEYQDFPESDIRIFPTLTDDRSVLSEGTPYGKAIRYFCEYYLEWVILWDANARKDPDAFMDGLWRAIPFYPPEPPYNITWNFTKYGPEDGRLVHLPESYPERTTWIKSYLEYPEAPEVNSVTVIGATDGSDEKLTFFRHNPRSYQRHSSDPVPDPDHVDFIGHEVPVVVKFSELVTSEGVMYVGQKVFRRAAYGRYRIDFFAPLVLFRDTSDPYQIRKRPHRYGDMIQIDGRPAMVQNCNPQILNETGDAFQWAFYECIYKD